jgi:DNA-binding transcriptional LysR family regulator
MLRRCLRVHPKARIEARVARNTELLDRIDTNELDLALVWDDSVSPGPELRSGAR